MIIFIQFQTWALLNAINDDKNDDYYFNDDDQIILITMIYW